MRRVSFGMLMGVALLATPVLAEEEATGSDTPNGNTFKRQGAFLDRSPQRRPHMISAFIGLPYGLWYYGGVPFGLGGRYMLPIIHDGFIPPVNDSFGIELGLDFTAVAGRVFYPGLSIPVEAYWMFHFTQNFALYAKVGFALEFNFAQYCDVRGFCYGAVGARPISGIGLTYKVSNALYLRVEAGYPWFKVGLGFGL